MGADDNTDYRSQAEAWLADDPDPKTRAALHGALDDRAQLAALFSAPLSFGTAGLRGRLGPGPARMNRRVVAKTTAGLCHYLASQMADAPGRGLCVARDARHGSDAFFDEVVQVALGAGFVVHAFEQCVPTPILAFAVRELNAAGGVMVTASHNPKQDNGYKVFYAGGAQLVAPHDRGIAAAAAQVHEVTALERVSLPQALTTGALRFHDEALVDRYRKRLLAALPAVETAPAIAAANHAAVRIAYTPLHGVAGPLAVDVLADAGFTDVHVVATQAKADPDFPTLDFPNPEEPGTVDALLQLATDINADLALANDPDGDRLAIGVRDDSNTFRLLTGNEVGLLLADYALERDKKVPHPKGESARPAVVCSTIVSSPMIADIAQHHGAQLALTLTGFKWMFARVAALEAAGQRFVFGFEDAMGYAATPLVRDKDGLSAAVLASQLAAQCRQQGGSLWTRLQRLFDQHGIAQSAQRSVSMTGPNARRRMQDRMVGLRAAPPTQLGDSAIVAISDYQTSLRSAGGTRSQLSLPKSDMLVLELTDGARVCIRPSGTEPKVKLYLDVRTQRLVGETLATARQRGQARLDALCAAALAWLGAGSP